MGERLVEKRICEIWTRTLGDPQTSSRITLQASSSVSAAEPNGWTCARQTEPRARSTAKGSTNVFQAETVRDINAGRNVHGSHSETCDGVMTEERPRALRTKPFGHVLRHLWVSRLVHLQAIGPAAPMGRIPHLRTPTDAQAAHLSVARMQARPCDWGALQEICST